VKTGLAALDDLPRLLQSANIERRKNQTPVRFSFLGRCTGTRVGSP
jgi:hypothetical protein